MLYNAKIVRDLVKKQKKLENLTIFQRVFCW